MEKNNGLVVTQICYVGWKLNLLHKKLLKIIFIQNPGKSMFTKTIHLIALPNEDEELAKDGYRNKRPHKSGAARRNEIKRKLGIKIKANGRPKSFAKNSA
jgi:hypothetical protein